MQMGLVHPGTSLGIVAVIMGSLDIIKLFSCILEWFYGAIQIYLVPEHYTTQDISYCGVGRGPDFL